MTKGTFGQNKLTHLFPMPLFSNHWKHQKTLRFPVFKGQRKDALGTNGLRMYFSWQSSMMEKNSGKEFIRILPSKFHIVIHVLQSMYVNKINNNETRKIPRNVFLVFFFVFFFQFCVSISQMDKLFEWGIPFIKKINFPKILSF